MKNKLVLVLGLLSASLAFGATGTEKKIDNLQATGGAFLTVPTVGTAVLSDTSTNTITNKTISGSTNTITNIAAGSITSGTFGVAQGGTGNSTLTSNAVLVGNGTSAVSQVGPGTQYQVFQAGASGVPAFGALNLNQSAAVTGSLGVANGGTGDATLTSNALLVGAGTSAVTFIAPGTANQVLISNGTSWSAGSVPSAAPAVNGSATTPQSISATGLTLTGLAMNNYSFIAGTASGTTVVTSTPSITACTSVGQVLRVVSTSATNFITLQDEASLAGSKLHLNGNWTSGTTVQGAWAVLTLLCDGNGFWFEEARNN